MLESRRLGSDAQLKQAAANNPSLSKARGSKGSGVAALQDLLADLGFILTKTLSRGKADGVFGTETDAAVKAFQAKAGLVVDGIAGTKTLHALDAQVRANYRLEDKDGRHDVALGYW